MAYYDFIVAVGKNSLARTGMTSIFATTGNHYLSLFYILSLPVWPLWQKSLGAAVGLRGRKLEALTPKRCVAEQKIETL